MQFAGRMADKVSPGRTVPLTITLAGTGFALFAYQISADASYWGLGAALLLMGAGGGSSIMPLMTAATRRMPQDQAAAASTTINLISNTSGAIGVAVASVLLSTGMAARVPVAREGGLQAVQGLAEDARDRIAPALADAFQFTAFFSVALIALSIVPALFLPRRDQPRDEGTATPASDDGSGEALVEARAS
jgi:MFS family permease